MTTIDELDHSEHRVVVNGHGNRWCEDCQEWALFDAGPSARDPVHEEAGRWYFWHEDWADRSGPFETRQGAQLALDWYVANELRGRGKLDPPLSTTGPPKHFYAAVHRAWNACAATNPIAQNYCQGSESLYEFDEHVCGRIAGALRVELHAAGIGAILTLGGTPATVIDARSRMRHGHADRIEPTCGQCADEHPIRMHVPKQPDYKVPFIVDLLGRRTGPDPEDREPIELRYETAHEAADEPNFDDEPCSICGYVGDPDGHAAWWRLKEDERRQQAIWRRASLRLGPLEEQPVMVTITGGHDEPTVETQRWECRRDRCYFTSTATVGDGSHWHARARRQDGYDTWSPWSDATPYKPTAADELREADLRHLIEQAQKNTIAGQSESLRQAAIELWDDVKRAIDHSWQVLTGRFF